MANIEAVELITIASGKPDDKGNYWRLRLVQWVVDGSAKDPKLERRRFFTDENGNERTGKCEGLSLRDLESCKPHWKKILELMKNPPKKKPMSADEAAEMAKEILADGEVPF